ncbi:aldose 1-epimerase [Pilibacter termitis]|uniref:Aldose 1-epimerase n=1 Tax=Pilibacter termitis TaxID=263852 RepID=A0A1T4PML0_9ENTE|nr:aldose epimerase family protein [Pilibacter termitis]SJZ92581.1 aldose 1-epimerase [Pilibacter termitis]
MKITQEPFGEGYTLITLENDNGVKLAFSDLGARIVSMKVPKDEGFRELVLGFDSAKEYLEKDTFMGATIGRVAGRIANGTFEVGDDHYHIPTNNLGNTLHGGTPSFDSAKWVFKTKETERSASIEFQLFSPDGENGFPGNLTVTVTYTFDNTNTWTIDYSATTDKETLFNPTNHVYFNFTGHPSQTVDEHTLQLSSDMFLLTHPLDNTVIGEVKKVDRTPFDFRKPKVLREVFQSDFPQKNQVDGIDHPFLLDSLSEDVPHAVLSLPKDDISIKMFTEETSVVVFTANFGEDTYEMRGEKLANHSGVTLETQNPPGSEQFTQFGEIEITPDRGFRSTTKFEIYF